MPIQFICEECRQPIEVDDEAANLQAYCPFCNAVVNVPAFSDISVAQPSPDSRATNALKTAQPVSHRPGAVAGSVLRPLENDSAAAHASATFGFLAMTTMIISGVLFLVLMTTVMLVMLPEMPPPGAMPDYEKLNDKLMTYAEDSPWFPVAAEFFRILGIVGVGMAIGSLIRKERPRWPALSVLAIGLGFMLLLLFSVMFFALLG